MELYDLSSFWRTCHLTGAGSYFFTDPKSVFPSVRESYDTCTWAGIILAHNAILAGELCEA
jgi:hypothetical protein